MNKYNLDNSNQIRLDYCNMQKTAVQVKECQTEYIQWLDNHDSYAIYISFIVIGLVLFGYFLGKIS